MFVYLSCVCVCVCVGVCACMRQALLLFSKRLPPPPKHTHARAHVLKRARTRIRTRTHMRATPPLPLPTHIHHYGPQPLAGAAAALLPFCCLQLQPAAHQLVQAVFQRALLRLLHAVPHLSRLVQGCLHTRPDKAHDACVRLLPQRPLWRRRVAPWDHRQEGDLARRACDEVFPCKCLWAGACAMCACKAWQGSTPLPLAHRAYTPFPASAEARR